jgi:MoaA/NifB/PqqE/SkfB family radical SAM enzyme
VEIAHGEMVEKQLDAMIQHRARKGDVDPEEREELWRQSVRRYNARRREENRLAWCGYFERLAGSLRARAEEYDHRAQALMETDQPKGAA